MEFEVGDIVVGKYEIKKLLGAGGMGKVYRARQVDLGRDVALKVPSQQVIESPEVMARFIREAKTVARLTHDNVVQVYEYHHEGDLAFIAMEFVEGKDLKAFVNTPPDDIKVSDVAAILEAACEGLGHAHEFGIVHRDIKPHNIMVARMPRGKWRVKVMDFGIAHVDQSSPFTQMDENQLTQTGQALGTPSYMAPEQIRGAGVSHLSDLYSFGCVVYYVFTRQTVFTGSGLTVAVAHLNEIPPSIRTQIPGIPESFDRVILKCLEKDSTGRYQTATDLGNAIREALAPIADTPMADIWRQSLQASDATIPILQAPTTPSGAQPSELIELQTKGTINRSSLLDPAHATTAKTVPDAPRPATPASSTPKVAASMAAEPTIAGAPLVDAPARPSVPAKKSPAIAIVGGVAGACLVAGIGAALFLKANSNGNGTESKPTPVPTAVAGGSDSTPAPVPTEVAMLVPTPPVEARPTPSPKPTPSPTPTPSPDEMARSRAMNFLTTASGEKSPLVMARAWKSTIEEARKVRDNQPVRAEILKMADQIANRMVTYPAVVEIAGSRFTMGQDDDPSESDARPRRSVQLNAYQIGKYEVTALEFATFLNNQPRTVASQYYAPREGFNIVFDEEIDRFVPAPDHELHPANGVSWKAAMEYASWLSGTTNKLYRLPTEAEWERAARGTGEWRFPFGNNLPSPSEANFGRSSTVAVNEGGQPGIGESLFHIGGNVAEWCQDWHDPDFYSRGPAENPTGPTDSEAEQGRLKRKVLRGGGYLASAAELSTTRRGRAEPPTEEPDIGFRLALTP